jgi:hypothetical protein
MHLYDRCKNPQNHQGGSSLRLPLLHIAEPRRRVRLDLINFLVGCVSSFITGMVFHSVLGHYCKNRHSWLCRLFHYNEEDLK